MERKREVLGSLVVMAVLAMCGRVWAQNPAQQQQPAATPSTAPTSAPPAVKPAAPAKKGKQPYNGPKDIIELPRTPMLDEEGKQRLDPDGKPMFNPPVKQERDRNGHPLFDDKGQPVFQTATDMGYDAKGKKINGKKEKEAKTISVEISKGTLTVDGMIGKARLNYDIKNFKYVYLYAPWIGTVVVSNRSFPGSKAQPNAFNQNTLTVTVEDHQFQVYSEKTILGGKPEPAYVAVDRDFKLSTQYPVMGYGSTLKTPYAWPGAKATPESKAYVKPPPLPVSLRPTMLLPACPAGQIRQTAKATLPGDETPSAPCVPMGAGKQGTAPAAAPADATPAPAGAPSPTAPESVPAPPPPAPSAGLEG